MVYDNIIIRTNQQLSNMDSRISKALYNLLKRPTIEIPLAYQYLQKTDMSNFFVDDDNRLGTVSNFKLDKDFNITGTVIINDLMTLSMNFQGVIDNMLVTVNANNNSLIVATFIIYDKEAKKEIDNRIKKNGINTPNIRLPKPGEIPLSSEIDMKKVTESLQSELNEFIKNQEDENGQSEQR